MNISFFLYYITITRSGLFLNAMFSVNKHATEFTLAVFKMESKVPHLAISKVQNAIMKAPHVAPEGVHFMDYFSDVTVPSLGFNISINASSWLQYVCARFYNFDPLDIWSESKCFKFFDAIYYDNMSIEDADRFENFVKNQEFSSQIPEPTKEELAYEQTLSRYPRDIYWCLLPADLYSISAEFFNADVYFRRMFTLPLSFDGADTVSNGVYARHRISIHSILTKVFNATNHPILHNLLAANLYARDYTGLKWNQLDNHMYDISGAIQAVHLWGTMMCSVKGKESLREILSRKYGMAFRIFARTSTEYFKRKMTRSEVFEELGTNGLGFLEITSPDVGMFTREQFQADLQQDLHNFIMNYIKDVLSKGKPIYVRGDLAVETMRLPRCLLRVNPKLYNKLPPRKYTERRAEETMELTKLVMYMPS